MQSYSQDARGRIVRDRTTEFLLEGHDEFDGIEAVGTKIVDGNSIVRDLIGIDPRCSTTIFFSRTPISLIVPTVVPNW